MTNVSEVEVPTVGWRLKLGVFLLIVSILLPLLGVPLLALMGFSSSTVAAASGVLLLVTVPKPRVIFSMFSLSCHRPLVNEI